MVQPLNYLRESPSQTAGPYVHIGLAPGAAGFEIFETELGTDIAGPNAAGERITVNDLLRHYPRKYSDGINVREEGEQIELEEGTHVTFVDTITKTDVRPMKSQHGKRQRKLLRVTLGDRNPPITATFFNADYLINNLVEGTRVMLSGEIGYFRNTVQLSHPAFLIIDSPTGRTIGTRSFAKIAEASGQSGDDVLAAFEKDFFPIYPATKKLQSWDIFACISQVLAVLDPVPELLPESILQQWDLISEDAALRGVHLAENSLERAAAQERLTYDEAVGLQWALVSRRYGELGETGPTAPARSPMPTAAPTKAPGPRERSPGRASPAMPTGPSTRASSSAACIRGRAC